MFGEGTIKLEDDIEQASDLLTEYGSLKSKTSQTKDREAPGDAATDDSFATTPPETPPKAASSKKDTKTLKPAITPRTAAILRVKPHVPPQNPCLWLFHLLQGIGVVASVMLWTTQVIPLFLSRGNVVAQVGWANLALKGYISAFCVVFMAVESDMPIPFLLQSNLLQRYFSRGFLYSFLCLICVQEAYSERIRDIVHKGQQSNREVGWAAIFMQLSSWLMLGVGTLYMLMGLCCLKRVRDRMKEKEQNEWKEYRAAMKEWKDLYG